jgi:hypothetical protein
MPVMVNEPFNHLSTLSRREIRCETSLLFDPRPFPQDHTGLMFAVSTGVKAEHFE